MEHQINSMDIPGDPARPGAPLKIKKKQDVLKSLKFFSYYLRYLVDLDLL